jgi:hypothetical protein
MRFSIILAVLMGLSGSANAAAIDAQIDKTAVKVTIPDDYCSLGSDAADKILIEQASAGVSSGGGQLLGLFADCAELKDWRAGSRKVLDHYGQLVVDLGDDPLDGTPTEYVQAVCQQATETNGDAQGKTDAELTTAAMAVVKSLAAGSVVELGTIAQDAKGCYSASVSRIDVEGGAGKDQISVLVNGVLASRPIYLMAFSPLDNPLAITRARAVVTGIMATMP